MRPNYCDSYLIVIFFAVRTPQGKKRAEKEAANPFDRTMIHPESYSKALKFVTMVGLHQQDIGSDVFIRSLQHFMQTASELKEHGNPACLQSNYCYHLIPLMVFVCIFKLLY